LPTAVDFLGFVFRRTPALRLKVKITSPRTQIEDSIVRGKPLDESAMFSVRYTGSRHRMFTLVSIKSACVLASPFPSGFPFTPVRIPAFTVRLVGRERKNDVQVDGLGVKYNTIDKASFAQITLGDKLKGIEDARIDLLTCPLPLDFGLLNFVLVSVTLNNVEVAFQSQC
jgi:hypothetical protein